MITKQECSVGISNTKIIKIQISIGSIEIVLHVDQFLPKWYIPEIKKKGEQSGPIGGQQAGSLAVGGRGRGTNDPKSLRSQHLDHWRSPLRIRYSPQLHSQTRAQLHFEHNYTLGGNFMNSFLRTLGWLERNANELKDTLWERVSRGAQVRVTESCAHCKLPLLSHIHECTRGLLWLSCTDR